MVCTTEIQGGETGWGTTETVLKQWIFALNPGPYLCDLGLFISVVSLP